MVSFYEIGMVRGERYEWSQVLVLPAACQLHYVYRDRASGSQA